MSYTRLLYSVRNGRYYLFQQDPPPSDMARVTKEWMAENFHVHINLITWTPNYPDLNPLDYNVSIVLEGEVNEHLHDTKDFLKLVIE